MLHQAVVVLLVAANNVSIARELNTFLLQYTANNS
jgi:hypothetical protein